MNHSDVESFLELWASAQEQYGKRPGPGAANLAFEVLKHLPLSDIAHALTKHLSDPVRGQFAPKPADVIAWLSPPANQDGRPGVEEAWALMPKQERDSEVITDEMAAAFGAALSLISDGDLIGARMAFKEVYLRAVETARAAGKPVRWFPSLGHDVEARAPALRRAVELGRLTQQRAVALLPSLDLATIDPNGHARLAHVKAPLLAKLRSPTTDSASEEIAA